MDSALGRTLTSSAVGLPLDLVSPEIRRHAARVIADTIGVALGGGKRPEIRSFVRGEEPLFTPLSGGDAQLFVPGLPGTDPATAAFVNATAGTFLELDEGYRPTGHPAMHVVPAALAAAQVLRSTGREFLTAVLAGYEVTARLFEAYRLIYPLHPHGHFGAVGAAVAVARLRNADPEEPAAIAATLPLLPVWQPCYEGATTRNAYTGTAAMIGVNANRMAAAGFTGSREAQSVAFGELVGELVNPGVLTEPVDLENLRITRNYLKLHSACALSHSALDAVLTLGSLSAEEIESVEVETVSNNMKISRLARPNDLSTRFSLPYAVAAAIVYGHTGPEAFVPDKRVFELAERVEVRTAEDLEDAWPTSAPARVTVRRRGEDRAHQVDNPRGHHANPVRPEELRNKFMMLAGENADSLYERLLALEEVQDMARIFERVA
ncbi:MAG: MmgE/PrpD family protein [Actinomycetota bacterium]|nr:MmgE/PrpD family protein [Actinomycetota bacterium]